MAGTLSEWCLCPCLSKKTDGTVYRTRNHVMRLLNAHTLANYVKLVLWVGSLVLVDQIIRLSANSTFIAMSPIIMFVVYFVVLEVSMCYFPRFYRRFKRFAGPGNAFLNQWIALMFFVFTVALPHALRRVPALTILGWAASIFFCTVIQTIGTAYFVVGWNRLFLGEKSLDASAQMEMPRPSRIENVPNPLAAGGAGTEIDHVSGAELDETSNRERSFSNRLSSTARPRLLSSASRKANAAAPALQFLKDVAADATKYDAVREERVNEAFYEYQEASYFDVQAGHLTGAKATSTNTLAGAVISLLKDALHNGKLNLAQQLTAYLETDFADDKDVQEFLALEKQKYEAELAEDDEERGSRLVQLKIEPDSAKVQILSHFDIISIFGFVAIASAVLALFDRGNPKPYVFVFQFAATIVAYISMTVYRAKLLGFLPPILLRVLQPGILVVSMLVIFAGGTWPNGFLQGLAKYRLRHELPLGEDTIFNGKWWQQALGPGEIIAMLMNPAIATLAVPTSAAMSTLAKKIHVIIVGAVWAGLLSFFAMAMLAFLLVNDDSVSLSLLPYTMSTAVAIGFSPLLCKGGTCADSSIVTTTCIVACFFQTVICQGLLNWCRVKDPAARGIAIGISTGALGVARLKKEGEIETAGIAAAAYAANAVITAFLILILLPVLASVSCAAPLD